MIDRNFLRTNPEKVKESLSKRGEDASLVDEIIAVDKKWREATAAIEPLRAEINTISRGGKPSPTELKKAKALSTQIDNQNKSLKELDVKLGALLLRLPNLVADDVSVGAGETANKVIKTVGSPAKTKGLPHHKLMEKLGWLNLEAASRASGSRFRYLIGPAAWAERQLMNEAMSLAIKSGFSPVIPPVMTRRSTLEDSGFLPFAEDDIFKVEQDQLYLTGTSEQTLLALVGNQTYKKADLPIRLVGFSTCFRREAGSYGKDVEGMFRQHQFDKVELVSITTPEESENELKLIASLEEKFTQKLGLPYQTVMIGSGDLGPTAAKKLDLEVWFPSQQRYRESHSASNCLDFQSRRMNIKFTDENNQETFAHTLNGTLATERLLLSLIENNQRADGSVKLPWRWRI